MSLILNIDTASETASICIAENGKVLHEIINNVQKDHASFLHHAINELIKSMSVELTDMDAIAVSNGPGSYTGLRVGMASAKGLCYALEKPFITIGTLDVMANAAISSEKESLHDLLYCPLIDARRMEVYTAVFNKDRKEITAPSALILNEDSFAEILHDHRICFFGSGARKLQNILTHENASFIEIGNTAASISILSYEKYCSKIFTDLAHSQPLYIKEFHSSPDLRNKK